MTVMYGLYRNDKQFPALKISASLLQVILEEHISLNSSIFEQFLSSFGPDYIDRKFSCGIENFSM